MAERLTKKIKKSVQDKYSLGTVLYYDFNGLDDANMLLNKLGKLEDIMEKYGVESVEELDEKLQCLNKQAENIKTLKQMRKFEIQNHNENICQQDTKNCGNCDFKHLEWCVLQPRCDCLFHQNTKCTTCPLKSITEVQNKKAIECLKQIKKFCKENIEFKDLFQENWLYTKINLMLGLLGDKK